MLGRNSKSGNVSPIFARAVCHAWAGESKDLARAEKTLANSVDGLTAKRKGVSPVHAWCARPAPGL